MQTDSQRYFLSGKPAYRGLSFRSCLGDVIINSPTNGPPAGGTKGNIRRNRQKKSQKECCSEKFRRRSPQADETRRDLLVLRKGRSARPIVENPGLVNVVGVVAGLEDVNDVENKKEPSHEGFSGKWRG